MNINVTASQIQAQFNDLLNLSSDYDDEDEEGNQKSLKREEVRPEIKRMLDANGKTYPDYGDDEGMNEDKVNSSLDMKMDISMASGTSGGDESMKLDMSTSEPKTENGYDQVPASSKEFISSAAVAELIRCLRAFYMLSWCKQMIRELFNITDAKFQDYSPSENQKVWDKQMHRRHVS